MTDLLESHFLWSSIRWLGLLGISLWLIAVLFPASGPSDDHLPENSISSEPKENTPISSTNQILHTQNKEI